MAVFRSEYQKGYDAGLQVLCSVQNASDDGRDAGLQGQTVAALPARYDLCSANKSSLAKTFLASYRNALSQYCSIDSAQSRGTQAGRSNQGLGTDATWLSCPAAERSRLKQAFQDAYVRGLRDYCDVNNHVETIRDLAKRSSQPSYDPQTFGSCAQQFPNLVNAYYDRFYQERQALVDRLCTYENGRVDGRTDADEMDRPRGSIPEFCDERAMRDYQRGYRRGFDEQKQIICERIDAQDMGYQDGQQGRAFNPHFPEACPADFHRTLRDRYRMGYERGRRNNEPAPVDPGPGKPYPGYPVPGGHIGPSSEAVIRACGEMFSFDSDKMECINIGKTIRHEPVALIQACQQAYSMTSDRLQCLRSGQGYYAASALLACTKAVSFTRDRQSCVERVKAVRFDPARDIEACTQAFSMTSDRLECIGLVGNAHRPLAGKIDSCQKAFHFTSDLMKCIRS